MSSPSSLDYEQAYVNALPALWRQTQSLGGTALRQSLLMHISVLNVAKAAVATGRLQATLCRQSGMGIPFHCAEDHGLTAAIDEGTGSLEMDIASGAFFCFGLRGSDCGCCGNYSGPCWYCDVICLAHDIACQNCSPSWFCLPGCVAGPCDLLAIDLPPTPPYRKRILLPNGAERRGSDAESSSGPPSEVELGSPFPNPSRFGLTIQFTLPQAMETSLRIYSLSGSLVKTFGGGRVEAGAHLVRWDRSTDQGGQARPGIYFCELRTGGVRLARRIVILQ
jgi:hypothetical protein